QPAGPPAYFGGADAVFLCQHATDPDAGRLLEIRHADLAAAQIGRGVDPPVVADIDRRMAEGAGDEGGDPDIRGLSPRRRHQMCAEGEFGDVELAVTEGALEDLLRVARYMGDVAALDRDPPIEKRAGAVIALTGQRQLQHHEPCLPPLLRAMA